MVSVGLMKWDGSEVWRWWFSSTILLSKWLVIWKERDIVSSSMTVLGFKREIRGKFSQIVVDERSKLSNQVITTESKGRLITSYRFRSQDDKVSYM